MVQQQDHHEEGEEKISIYSENKKFIVGFQQRKLTTQKLISV